MRAESAQQIEVFILDTLSDVHPHDRVKEFALVL